MKMNERLSQHFVLGELCKTSVKIENVPNEVQVENLKRLCRWLERLRLRCNQIRNEELEIRNEIPIIINSGFRSAAVNRAVGGSATSNHLTGCAVDIRFYDLKRTGMLKDANYLKETHPDLGQYFSPEYAVRPIPQTYLQSISNGAEYQNPGYSF